MPAAADQEPRGQGGAGARAAEGPPAQRRRLALTAAWWTRWACCRRRSDRRHAARRFGAVGRAGAGWRGRGRTWAEARLAEATQPAGRAYAVAAQPWWRGGWRRQEWRQERLPCRLQQPQRVRRRGRGVREAAGALSAAAAGQQLQVRERPGSSSTGGSTKCTLHGQDAPLHADRPRLSCQPQHAQLIQPSAFPFYPAGLDPVLSRAPSSRCSPAPFPAPLFQGVPSACVGAAPACKQGP